MKGLILLGALLGYSIVGFSADRLIVSDIDDTVKISHVLDFADKIESGFNVTDAFHGTAELLTVLKRENKASLHFVSNAPQTLMEPTHETFLYLNGFPSGPLWLRDLLDGEDHKFQTISHLIRTRHPTDVLLLGDNGEQDTLVYDRIQKAFPRIRFTTLIHQVYSIRSPDEPGMPLAQDQTGWITTGDAAVLLYGKGWLSEKSVPYFLKELESIQSKKNHEKIEAFFPGWVDCRDFKANLRSGHSFDVRFLVRALEYRCRILL